MFKDNPKLKSVLIAGFLLSLHLALTGYINSSFLSSFVGEEWVGFVYVFGSIVSILTLIMSPEIFRKIGGYKFLMYVSILDSVALMLFSITRNILIVIPTFVIYFALNYLIIFSLDEVLKIFSKNSGVGKIRGLYLAICNLGWAAAQFGSSKLLSQSSFEGLYFATYIIMVVFLVIALFSFRNIPDPKYDRMHILRYVKEFFKNKNLFRAYNINFLLQFFYAWMIIYTPLYLHGHLGYSWEEVSTIFAIMLMAFVIIQFPLGNYADKIGERKMLMWGFLIISLSTLSLFFIKLHAVWIWALLLFITRIGAAMIEVMSDVYFFKHIKPENEEFIGVYRSTAPVSYIVGPLVAFVVFYFLPTFNFIYIVLGAIMLYGIYLSSTIRKGDI